jgi:hypothetical protein
VSESDRPLSRGSAHSQFPRFNADGLPEDLTPGVAVGPEVVARHPNPDRLLTSADPQMQERSRPLARDFPLSRRRQPGRAWARCVSDGTESSPEGRVGVAQALRLPRDPARISGASRP